MEHIHAFNSKYLYNLQNSNKKSIDYISKEEHYDFSKNSLYKLKNIKNKYNIIHKSENEKMNILSMMQTNTRGTNIVPNNSIINSKRTVILEKFIDYKKLERDNLEIVFPEKKILVLFSCHTTDKRKYDTIINNLKYFNKFSNLDIVIINSLGLPYSQNDFQDKCVKYFGIENMASVDFGKWIYALKNFDFSSYNNVIFTNDSFIIHDKIDVFLVKAANTHVELFGYNDSTEKKYHYQSYLFSIRSESIYKFIDMFEIKRDNLKSSIDVINKCELEMINYFNTSDCYLKIGNFPSNRNKNIFFKNDFLYDKLKNNGLLPFTKLKRLQ